MLSIFPTALSVLLDQSLENKTKRDFVRWFWVENYSQRIWNSKNITSHESLFALYHIVFLLVKISHEIVSATHFFGHFIDTHSHELKNLKARRQIFSHKFFGANWLVLSFQKNHTRCLYAWKSLFNVCRMLRNETVPTPLILNFRFCTNVSTLKSWDFLSPSCDNL